MTVFPTAAPKYYVLKGYGIPRIESNLKNLTKLVKVLYPGGGGKIGVRKGCFLAVFGIWPKWPIWPKWLKSAKMAVFLHVVLVLSPVFPSGKCLKMAIFGLFILNVECYSSGSINAYFYIGSFKSI